VAADPTTGRSPYAPPPKKTKFADLPDAVKKKRILDAQAAGRLSGIKTQQALKFHGLTPPGKSPGRTEVSYGSGGLVGELATIPFKAVATAANVAGYVNPAAAVLEAPLTIEQTLNAIKSSRESAKRGDYFPAATLAGLSTGPLSPFRRGAPKGPLSPPKNLAALGGKATDVEAEVKKILNDHASYNYSRGRPELTRDAVKAIRDLRSSAAASVARRGASVEPPSSLPSVQPRSIAPLPKEPPPVLGTPEEVSAKLTTAKQARRRQEQLYRQERGRRAGAAEEAMKAGGQQGYEAALEELGGELPKLQFHGFENFDQGGLDALFTHVQEHEGLRTYEKIRTQKALLSVKSGNVPTRSEIKLLERVFGETATQNLVDSVPWHARAKHVGMEILNVPRSLMASFDLSAPFRQGLMVAPRYPRTFFRNFNSMFRAFGSEKAYLAIHEDIVNRPTFDLMQRGGLALTELGSLEQREEQFLSNFAERIPVAGHGVRASGRAYTGFLNKTRADVFDTLVSKAAEQGLDVEDDKLLQSIARFVNSATGRGDLGAMQKHALALNTLMFSPRLLWSRLNFMNPVYYARLDPFARKEALKAAVSLAGTISLVLYLAKLGGANVNTDPRNADFAKMRFGNTRVDVLGGFQQPLRVIAQLTSGKIVSSTTGKTLTLGPQGPGKLSRRDILQRFFETKLAPVPSLINDAFKGTDFEGKPFSWKKAAYQRMIPLLAQDAADLYHEGGWLPAVGGYGLGAFGVGIQTYGPKQKTSPISGNPYDTLPSGAGSAYDTSSAGGGSPYAP
jgi:hypothetical protein